MQYFDITTLIGQVLSQVQAINLTTEYERRFIPPVDQGGSLYPLTISFTHVDGRRLIMRNSREAGELWRLVSIEGDLNDLAGHPILFVKEEIHSYSHSCANYDGIMSNEYHVGLLFKLASNKGPVNLFWECLQGCDGHSSIKLIESTDNAFQEQNPICTPGSAPQSRPENLSRYQIFNNINKIKF